MEKRGENGENVGKAMGKHHIGNIMDVCWFLFEVWMFSVSSIFSQTRVDRR